mgnify:CR=1 FL=1
MSYIGNQSENKVSPAKMREYVTPNGSATYFDLSHDIPGYGAENLIVVVNNVIQEPASAYTIKNDANGRPRRLDFGSGNVLATTDTCYVIYQSTGQIYHTPPANSVGYSQLEANLRSGRVDQFAGSAGASSNTVFTLTESALNANSIMVYVNGIYQRPTTNYTVSGTALTFTASLVDTDEVDVHHMSIRSTVSHVADGSVTSAKLDDNITIAGNLTVSGNTTTITSTTLTVDDKNIEMAATDSPTDANADGGGIILKGTTDKTILWENDTDSWNFSEHIETANNKKIKAKGEAIMHSLHRSWVLGG